MLKEEDVKLIHKFVDDGITELKKHGLMIQSGNIPIEMQDESFNRKNEYNNWVPTKSTVSDSDITELECLVNCEFPDSFKVFLKYKHFYELFLPGVTEVQFYSHPIYKWKKKYQNNYSYDWIQEDLIQNKFIPFADHEDWGMLCFDAQKPVEHNEFPILMVDHEVSNEIDKYQKFNLNFMDMVKSRLIYY